MIATSRSPKIQLCAADASSLQDRSCNTAKAVFALKTKHKLCLSGTPLQNRIGELFSLLRFLELDPFAYYLDRKSVV